MTQDCSPVLPGLSGRETNYVFLGEAGCGKSEIAVNLALRLSEAGREVHFFDLDMTKPLFRSRDLDELFAANGVTLHFQEQFMDAPTMVGGVQRLMRSDDCSVVLDIGGDYIGARSIGRYAPLMNGDHTAVYYIINPFRPWSDTLEHIDMVLSEILAVTHIQPGRLHLIGNPNLGPETTAEDFTEGALRLRELLSGTLPIDFFAAEEQLVPALADGGLPLFPLHRYLAYPWYIPGEGSVSHITTNNKGD